MARQSVTIGQPVADDDLPSLRSEPGSEDLQRSADSPQGSLTATELFRLAKEHHETTQIELRKPIVESEAGDVTDRFWVSHASKRGAFLGVFIPTCENMWGVLIFLQFHVMVGNAGVLQALGAVFLAFCSSLCTTASLTAIASSGGFVSEGGPYYMISRAMGPTVGVTVGLVYWVGLTLLAVLEVIGAVETVLMIREDWNFSGVRQLFGSILMLALVLLVYLGINVVTKLGAVFAIVVFFTIGSYYAGILLAEENNSYSHVGVTGLSWDTLGDNMQSHYLPGITFGHVMATFFPCFTGILSGANRADILVDPPHDIKMGTYGAIVFSAIMYTSFMILWGAVASSSYLRGDAPREVAETLRRLAAVSNAQYVVSDIAWSPFPHCVHIGVIISSLSQALQCLIVASKLFQRLANDRILLSLRFAAPLSKNNEPQRALLVTYIVGALFVLIGELHVIAPLLSMFFLTAYANMNASCGVLTLLRAPSWRPHGIFRRKWRAWYQATSFLGFVLCLTIMFIINTSWAIIAMLATVLLYIFVDWQNERVDWGSGLDGIKFHIALSSLLSLENRQSCQVNWRPQVLILYRIRMSDELKGIKRHEILKIYSQLRKGHGMCVVAAVLEDNKRDPQALLKARSEKQVILNIMREERIPGFVEVVVAPTWCEGANYIIQLTGLGGLVPNCVMMGWPHEWQKTRQKAADFISIIETALAEDKSVICAKDLANFPTTPCHGTIDIWWMIHDGGFMILLSWILTQHRVWRECHIRVFTVTENCDPEKAAQAAEVLSAILRKKRLADVDVEVIIADDEIMEPYTAEYYTERHQLFRDLQERGLINEDRVARAEMLLPVEIDDLFSATLPFESPRTKLVRTGKINVQDERRISVTLRDAAKLRKSNIDPNVPPNTADFSSKQDDDQSLLSTSILRRELTDESMDSSSPMSGKLSGREYRREKMIHSLFHSKKSSDMIGCRASSSSPAKVDRPHAGPVDLALANPSVDGTDVVIEGGMDEQDQLMSFRSLNRIILKKSKRAELVVMNLPNIWSQEQKEAERFMAACDMLTNGLDRVMLIQSSGHEVFDI